MIRRPWLRKARSQGWYTVLALTALLVVAAPAGATVGAFQPSPPLRAATFYSWFPHAWHGARPQPYSHYTPSAGAYSSAASAVIRRQLAALEYAHVDAALVPIDGMRTVSSRRLRRLLAIAAGSGAKVRFAAVYEPEARADPSVQRLRRDLRQIVRQEATFGSYLRIGGRPVVLVAAGPRDGCGAARRWHAANRVGVHLVLRAFRGYAACARLVASWFGVAPTRAESQVQGRSFSISPGYFGGRESQPRLVRRLTTWRRAIHDMVASRAPWQIVTSFNDWGSGTAVESAREWRSASGYGDYLDALAVDGETAAVAPPTVAAVGANGVSTSSATLTGSIDPAGGPTSYRFEYGIGADYGSATAAAVVPAGGAQSVSAIVTGLQPETTYHFRLAATNSAGTATTADVSFSTAGSAAAAGDPLIAAAGDIACDPSDSNFHGGAGTPTACHEQLVSDLVIGAAPAAVLTLGDNQYEAGTTSAFAASYGPSWGRFRNLTRPAVGNHEYQTSGASGYFAYFGAAAGPSGLGYYSYDVGAWHLISLNSNCSPAGGCNPGSPQEAWLKSDLAAHPNACTLAYWHHPRFSSGEHGDQLQTQPLLNDLYAAGADVVLNGHDHDYERFAPQTPDGVPDPQRGIREFVVGTGGKSHYAIRNLQPSSEVHDNTTFGVLLLGLHPGSYDWRFVPEPGRTFTDAGSQSCH